MTQWLIYKTDQIAELRRLEALNLWLIAAMCDVSPEVLAETPPEGTVHARCVGLRLLLQRITTLIRRDMARDDEEAARRDEESSPLYSMARLCTDATTTDRVDLFSCSEHQLMVIYAQTLAYFRS